MYFRKYLQKLKEIDCNFSDDFIYQVSPFLQKIINEDIRKMELWKEIYD